MYRISLRKVVPWYLSPWRVTLSDCIVTGAGAK